MKKCSRCGETTAGFAADNRASDGLQSQCRQCGREKSAAYYEANRVAMLAGMKQAYPARKEKVLTYQRDYYIANRDAVRTRVKIYAVANTRAVAATKKLYREKDLEAIRTRGRANYHANPTPYKARAHARKAGLQGKPSFTGDDVARLLNLQRGRCVYCKCDLESYEIDHVVALSRGGSNAADNIQLLCRPCNRGKWAHDSVEFMQRRGYLL